MRLAIATQDNMVSAHFGHCEAFTLVDIENGTVADTAVVPAPPHEPGLLPKFLGEHGANVIIAGGMGPRAQDLFQARGIRVIAGVQGAIEDVVKAFVAGSLRGGENLCDSHSGEGHECNH